MKLLAVETATEACSAALSVNGEISQKYEVAPRRHTELILPMVQGLLADADLSLQQLDAITFGRGPGAFTGVRLATAVVQGMALGADLPVVPISTLACLAQGAYRATGQGNWLAAIDARMSEVYWANYRIDAGVACLLGEERVCAPNRVQQVVEASWQAVGSGWVSFGEILSEHLNIDISLCELVPFPQAQDLIPLALAAKTRNGWVPVEQALPLYLRDKVAKKKSS